MGYQESFIKFKDEKTLVEQLKKYGKRDKAKDLAEIVCVDRVKKDIVRSKEVN
jgi:16S rRNA C1402 N4-methylase RsmH